MKEIWKQISGYENLYEVSNLGNVRNCRTGRILSPGDNGRGYLLVNLWKNGEQSLYCRRISLEICRIKI